MSLAAAKRLLEQARTQGARVGSVTVESADGMGLGLVATRKLRAGQPVLRLPESLWRPLSADEAYVQLKDRHPALLDDLMDFAQAQDIPMQSRLLLVGSVCFVLHLLREIAAPSSEATALHLNAMPKSVSTPLFWDATQMARLQASPLVSKISERRQLIDSIFTHVVEPHVGAMPEANVTPSNFSFAWSLLLSRAISDLRSRMPFTLPPVLDMMNHVSAANASQISSFLPHSALGSEPTATVSPMSADVPQGKCQHWFDHLSSSFVVAPLQDVPEGSQLFISYGDLSNADLLRLYGFTMEANAFDGVDFLVSTPTGPARHRCRIDGSLEYPQDGPRVDPLTLERSLSRCLEAYESSARDDLSFLKTQVRASQDVIDATRVRLGEKQSLERALAALQS
ncbi:Histone-lysine N-methyltransferase setd3 [Hondaea fermentalgiana]|uniref:Histone-lysine N-methyltransferase setd3 n=1 Tax=Hondaea fermentalgiana TaxID=2315210 RepID=A0A2R5G9C1_9STRA|nr:Histone-lysine N-methyltransferase setd3 [Hondaea fermentalgiana]|eukprot:GBG27145.1 Histone-lysine N-methyltransferase setd3 [Hondaea fermentalgiana]